MSFTARLAILLGGLALSLRAEPWQGRVFERGGASPIAGALFRDLSGTVLAESAADGAFSVLTPPALVQVSADGFATRSFKPGPARIGLNRVDFEGDEVVVTGKRDKSPGQSRLEGSQIRRIAGAGGDALRAVRALPGVAAISDFSGALSVRGGGPEDNQYFIDAIPWPVPYHFGGLLTTINADLLESVELYAGGFPARFGNADGAIIEAKTRKGKNRFSGNADVNLVTASLLLEGPLGLSPTAAGSWTLSGRRSYFDLILPHVMDLNNTALPYFWDLGATLRYDFSPTSRLRMLALSTDDQLAFVLKKEDVHSSDFAGEIRFQNRYTSLGANWEAEWLGRLRTRTVLYGYEQGTNSAFGTGYYANSERLLGGLNEEMELSLGEHTLGFGAGTQRARQDVEAYGYARSGSQGPGTFTYSELRTITLSAEVGIHDAYLEDSWKILPSLKIDGGLRYDRGWRAVEALSPRAGLEWKPLSATILRLAWGIYAQSPNGRQLSDEFGNPQLSAISAQHRVVSLEQGLTSALSARAELYHKTWDDLVVEVPDRRIYANDGEGQATGAELYIRYDDKSRLFGWLSAAWSRSERRDGPTADWRLYEYDQPLVLGLISAYRITPRWDFSLSLAYHSGTLITPVINGYYDPSTDSWYPIYGAPLSERLGDYLRLDLKTEYKWTFETWALSFYIELINATNSPNPLDRRYSRDYKTYDTISQIPRLPYFGLTASF